MPSASGRIAAGSFPVIPLSRKRPAESSISMRVIGRASLHDEVVHSGLSALAIGWIGHG